MTYFDCWIDKGCYVLAESQSVCGDFTHTTRQHHIKNISKFPLIPMRNLSHCMCVCKCVRWCNKCIFCGFNIIYRIKYKFYFYSHPILHDTIMKLFYEHARNCDISYSTLIIGCLLLSSLTVNIYIHTKIWKEYSYYTTDFNIKITYPLLLKCFCVCHIV